MFADVPFKKILEEGLVSRTGIFDDPELLLHWQITMLSDDAMNARPRKFISARSRVKNAMPRKVFASWDYELHFYYYPISSLAYVYCFRSDKSNPVDAHHDVTFTTVKEMLSTYLGNFEQIILSPMARMAKRLS